jgi:transcriptional regulatory protein LEU3
VRTAFIMNDLWHSNKVFRKKNGQVESLGLRLRTRLGMSVSYDMFWYWREEFGNMQNPYGDEMTAPSNDPTRPTTPREQQQYNIDTPMLTDSARAPMQHQQQQQLPGLPMSSQIPLTKFDPSLVQTQPDPSIMSFDTWDGSDYNVPPIMDQFPDYDWAAGFDFSNTEFPTVPAGPIGGGPLMPGGMGNMGYTFG